MGASEIAGRRGAPGLRREALRRMAALDPGGLVGVMARREALRFLGSGRSRQGLCLALLAACSTVLLIPLHRAFGDDPTSAPPYFLIFSLLVQIALAGLAGRAVWTSIRQDLAAGSAEELLLTGARP